MRMGRAALTVAISRRIARIRWGCVVELADRLPPVHVPCGNSCCKPTGHEAPINQTAVPAHQLTDAVLAAQGPGCIVPHCTSLWTQKAHIEGSGHGGRPSTYNPENLVGMCRPHHDIFDGRDMAGRQRMLRDLMRVHADRVRADRIRMNSPHGEPCCPSCGGAHTPYCP